MFKDLKITKQHLIYAGVTVAVIIGYVVFLKYAKKKMLRDTIDYYDKQKKEPQI